MKNSRVGIGFLRVAMIIGSGLLFVQQPSAQKKDPDFKKLKMAVDSALTEAERNGFAGTIRLKKDNDDIILYKGYGYSDCAQKKRTARNMIYDIGSITKAITAVAVLRLVQNQKMSLEKKVGDFLPGWPDDKKDISIMHLLTHMSGLQESLGEDEDTSIKKEGFMQKVNHSKLLFHPGDSVSYSNTGYTILGYIIEAVTGVSYESFVKKELFDPIKIRKMGYTIPKWKKNEIVCGLRNKKPWGATFRYFAKDGPSPYLFANGGMMANADELSHFFESLIKKELLPKQLEEMMVSRMTSKTKAGNPLLHISGSNLIFTAAYSRWMNNGMSVVLFTNNSEYPKEKIERQVLGIIEAFINSNRK
jgi:CubicO group peptidase (beta-lactamase class C family)